MRRLDYEVGKLALSLKTKAENRENEKFNFNEVMHKLVKFYLSKRNELLENKKPSLKDSDVGESMIVT